MQKSNQKKWVFASLAAAALTLSACADKDAATTQDDPTVDAQTPVEQEASGVDSANGTTDEMGSTRGEVASLEGNSSDEVTTTGNAAAETLTNEDIGVADSTATGIDDADIIDGSESEEHISTY